MNSGTGRWSVTLIVGGLFVGVSLVVMYSARTVARVPVVSPAAENTFATSTQMQGNLYAAVMPLSNPLPLGQRSARATDGIDWSTARTKRDAFFAKHQNTQNGISVSTVFADEVDPSVSTSPDSIDEIEIYIQVTNTSAQNMPQLSVPTGIRKGTLTYVRVEGVTGYEWIDGELVLQYVSLAPGASVVLSVTGLPVISPDPVSISLQPAVLDQSSRLLVRGVANHREIAGKLVSLRGQTRVRDRSDEIVSASTSSTQ